MWLHFRNSRFEIIKSVQTCDIAHFRNSRFEIKNSVKTCDIPSSFEPFYGDYGNMIHFAVTDLA